jgi:phage shock protein C
MTMVSVIPVIILCVVVLFVLGLLAGLVALVVALTRRSRRVQEEHSARIGREIDKIDAMLAAGRISAAESAELRQALVDQGTTTTPASRRRLCKSSSALLAGVCGGLAEWMNWDPTLVRVGYVLATLLIAAFPGIIIYLILALVMPRAADAPPSGAGRAFLIVALVVLGTVVTIVLAAIALLFFARFRCHV